MEKCAPTHFVLDHYLLYSYMKPTCPLDLGACRVLSNEKMVTFVFTLTTPLGYSGYVQTHSACVKEGLILPVCFLSVALFFRKLLIQGGGGASLSADPTVASWAIISRHSPSSSTCSTRDGSISLLLQSLQLGKRNDVTALRPVPHCTLGGGVVVVKA